MLKLKGQCPLPRVSLDPRLAGMALKSKLHIYQPKCTLQEHRTSRAKAQKNRFIKEVCCSTYKRGRRCPCVKGSSTTQSLQNQCNTRPSSTPKTPTAEAFNCFHMARIACAITGGPRSPVCSIKLVSVKQTGGTKKACARTIGSGSLVCSMKLVST